MKIKFLMLTLVLLSINSNFSYLLGAETFECNYTHYSQLEAGENFLPEKFKVKKSEEEFKISFLVDEDKAYMLGNVASGELDIFLPRTKSYTFIEIINFLGSMSITSIDLETLDTVHSRHIMILKRSPFPSQFYGKCIIK